VDQIIEAFSLYDADIFQAGNAVISESERFLFDSAEPPCKPGEIEWVLFASIHENHTVRRFERRSAALGNDCNQRRRHRSRSHLPFQRGSNQGAASHRF
jgi:hypothetical protein